jgi:hypothetical protein
MTSAAAAARSTGIPERNITRWRDDPAMAEYVQKTRDALADDIRIAAAVAWDQLIKRIRSGDIETRDLIVAAGVAVDKSQLLTGGATSRTEARDLTGTFSDERVAALIREADEIATGGRAAEAAAGTPEG